MFDKRDNLDICGSGSVSPVGLDLTTEQWFTMVGLLITAVSTLVGVLAFLASRRDRKHDLAVGSDTPDPFDARDAGSRQDARARARIPPEQRDLLASLIDRVPQATLLGERTDGLLAQVHTSAVFVLLPAPPDSWPEALIDRYRGDLLTTSLRLHGLGNSRSAPLSRPLIWPADVVMAREQRFAYLKRAIYEDYGIEPGLEENVLAERLRNAFDRRDRDTVYQYAIDSRSALRDDPRLLQDLAGFWSRVPPFRSGKLLLIFVTLGLSSSFFRRCCDALYITPGMHRFLSSSYGLATQDVSLNELGEVQATHLEQWLSRFRDDRLRKKFDYSTLETRVHALFPDKTRSIGYKRIERDIKAALTDSWRGTPS